MSLNSVSETSLSSRACETQLFIQSCFATAKAWILECLLTFRSNFLLTTVRPVETTPHHAPIAPRGASTTIPTPVSDVATAPEDRTAVGAAKTGHGIDNHFPNVFVFFQHKPVMLDLIDYLFFNFANNGSPKPIPAVDFLKQIQSNIGEVLNKEQKIYVTPTDFFHHAVQTDFQGHAD